MPKGKVFGIMCADQLSWSTIPIFRIWKKESERLLCFTMIWEKPRFGIMKKIPSAPRKIWKKGELHQAMIGHAEAGLNKIQERLSANGISQDDLEIITTIIKNHMQTSIADQDPKKTKVLIESFGKDDEER